MIDYAYNAETKAEREARRARAHEINAGVRGADGLTDPERALLATLRSAGYELAGAPVYARYQGRAA